MKMHVGHENCMFSKSSNDALLLGFHLFSTIIPLSASFYLAIRFTFQAIMTGCQNL